MKGSIRFNNDIIAEVDVDPSAASGSRLTSCKNLIDGQELGGGGGSSDFSIAEITVNSVFNDPEHIWYLASVLIRDENVSSLFWLDADDIPTYGFYIGYEMTEDSPSKIYALMYNGEGKLQIVDGTNVSVSGNAEYDSDTRWITFTGDFTLNITAIEP